MVPFLIVSAIAAIWSGVASAASTHASLHVRSGVSENTLLSIAKHAVVKHLANTKHLPDSKRSLQWDVNGAVTATSNYINSTPGGPVVGLDACQRNKTGVEVGRFDELWRIDGYIVRVQGILCSDGTRLPDTWDIIGEYETPNLPPPSFTPGVGVSPSIVNGTNQAVDGSDDSAAAVDQGGGGEDPAAEPADDGSDQPAANPGDGGSVQYTDPGAPDYEDPAGDCEDD